MSTHGLTRDHSVDPAADTINSATSYRHVAFNKPAYIGTEMDAIRTAVVQHKQISGVGRFTRQCEALLSKLYGNPVLLTTSATHALEMAAHLFALEPGDAVIVPSYTFVSTANAFVLRGCEIQFADCDEHGQLCLEDVQRVMTDKTKAVCVVHYGGNSTDMKALTAFCQANNLMMMEDAAQAIGSECDGKLLGTWGDLACLSFHETKNVTSGEGGALIVNNPDLLARAHFIREKGTNRMQFSQGMVDKYTWIDIGSSYELSDMNAAYLSVQLEQLDEVRQKRHAIWNRYHTELSPLVEQMGAMILENPARNLPNYHLFALVFDKPSRRTAFIDFMRSRNIVTPFHYVPLHESAMGKRFVPKQAGQDDAALKPERFRNTLRLGHGLVRLPLFYNLSEDEQTCVIEAITAFATDGGSA